MNQLTGESADRLTLTLAAFLAEGDGAKRHYTLNATRYTLEKGLGRNKHREYLRTKNRSNYEQ